LPPTAGFIGKLYLFIALIDAKMIVVAVIALLNSVVSLYYYARVLKHMFLVKPETEAPTISISRTDTILVSVFVAAILVLGVYFEPLINAAKACMVILGI
jgi:NADH-quinone oxidoreductase subunit N